MSVRYPNLVPFPALPIGRNNYETGVPACRAGDRRNSALAPGAAIARRLIAIFCRRVGVGHIGRWTSL